MWSTILSWGMKGVGFIAPFKMQILIGAGVALSIIIGVHLWHDYSIKKERDKLVGENRVLVERFANAVSTIRNNEKAYKVCLQVNQENAIALSDQREKAQKAVASIATLKAMNERDNQDIVRITDEQRGKDNECRTVDDPLPDRVLIGVFD